MRITGTVTAILASAVDNVVHNLPLFIKTSSI